MQTFLAIAFVLLLTLFLIWKRHKVQLQKLIFPLFYVVMYRTKFGLRAMNWIGTRMGMIVRPLSTLGIGIGFAGMGLIIFELGRTIYTLFTSPVAPAGVGIVQPFVPNVPGTVFVPFLYFLASIAIIAILHEAAHGVVARAYNIKIHSSGFAFMSILVPVIPAAFVEPDEKTMKKRPLKQQLAVFAAGAVTNIVLAFVVLGFFALVLEPVVLAVADFEGIRVAGFANVSAARDAGISEGELITHVDGVELHDLSNYSAFLAPHHPGETIVITTNVSEYPVVLGTHPENATKAYLGITPKPEIGPSPEFSAKYGVWTAEFILWLIGLFFWLYLLSMGIGLFNLLPLGPVDGGRMLYALLTTYMPKERAERIFGWTSTLMLGMIIVTIGGAIFL